MTKYVEKLKCDCTGGKRKCQNAKTNYNTSAV